MVFIFYKLRYGVGSGAEGFWAIQSKRERLGRVRVLAHYD